MALLQLRGVSKQYPGTARPALDGIDLTVRRGERIAILGLSGAGKSTLIRCINRLVEPTAGHMTWFGEAPDGTIPLGTASNGSASGTAVITRDLNNREASAHAQARAADDANTGQGIDVRMLRGMALRAYRRRIGMIFQEFHLVDRLSVLANVLTGRFGYVGPWSAAFGRYLPTDVDAANAALARVGLRGYERRRARELSGGQRQRVAIARALVQQPLLLLGDEPVSNLDPITARGVMGLLSEINERDGLTMMINLHSVELAVRFAHRIIGMHDGRIVFDDGPDRLDDAALTAIYGDAASVASV